jgi:hypothetical protein
MSFAQLFSVASTAAMLGWASLILLPRYSIVTEGLRYGLIGSLSALYAVLIMLFFFGIEGGGFGSIGEVRALFLSDAGLLAGWVHYLAFDLFVGLWIASEADRTGMSRILQAPILVATFMFGPIGLLIYLVCRAIQPSLLFRTGE